MKTSKSISKVRSEISPPQANDRGRGYLLSADEGENLIHFRDQGRISIKASSATGSDGLALATQQVMRGSGIPTHRHPGMDEVFFVLEGGGVFYLEGVPHAFEKSTTLFIPANTWHGFENPDEELLLLWVVAPALLDGFFRATCSRANEPPKQLSPEAIRAIALEYGTEFQ
jgi:quercetin dioxygenase-like cupin family protein